MSKLKIYKASAGSGKTHSLTEEYLELSKRYPDNFRRILAVTFTNKAAEEMKNRILESLNQIIEKGKEADFYSILEDSDTSHKEFEIIEKAREIRNNILHDYSFFSLSTIDSFVQKVIKSFTYEIGINSGYSIELDTEKVISDLTEILYRQIDIDKDLRNYLIHFANYQLAEGKNWDFRSEINKLAYEVFKEEFNVQSRDEETGNDYNEFIDFYSGLQQVKISFQSKLNEISKKALEKFNAIQPDFGQISQGIRYVHNYLVNKISSAGSLDDYYPNKTIVNMMDNREKWWNKTANQKVRDLSAEIYSEINPLLVKVMELMEKDFRYFLGAKNLEESFHAFGILRKLASLLPDYRNERNILLISDTTRILKEIISDNDAPFIYEKIGNRFRHILIDEFQDTSGFQWENFKPLVKNSLAEGNQNLIVGDIKQSIYRWRGGDWRLLLHKVESDIGKEYIDAQNLETNWRSKKNIIDFNNSLFKNAAELLQFYFISEINPAWQNEEIIKWLNDNSLTIIKAYSDTYQKIPGKPAKEGGRVKVQFFENKPGSRKSWMDEVAETLPELINELLKNKNYEPGDIALLVRRNEEGKKAVKLLLDYQSSHPESEKYQIISSDSLVVSSSPAIQILVSAIYYINNQNDQVHLKSLIVHYQKYIKGIENISSQHFTKNKGSENFLPGSFIHNIANYKRKSIYDLTEQLCDVFELEQLTGQNAYIETFKDKVAEFNQGEYADILAFLEWWEFKGNKISVQLSGQRDSINILSIHKSKGLAFKVVIVPYCDWDLKPGQGHNNIIWTKSESEPFNKFEKIPVTYRKYLVDSIFCKEYAAEMLYSLIDALNLLYVAFTRPKEELIVLAPLSVNKDNGFSSIGGLLFNCLVQPSKDNQLLPLADYYFPEGRLFELHKGYNDFDKDKFAKEKLEANLFRIQNFPKGNWENKINLMDHTDEFFIKSIEYIENQVNYGLFMHEIFSKIKYQNDLENIIEGYYFEGKINSGEKTALFEKVRNILNRKSVSEWFTEDWTVKTEEAILDISGNIRIPDRVLIKKDKTLVIDFKFGAYDPESELQIKEYIELLRKMNYPDVSGIIYYAETDLAQQVQ